MTYTTEDFQHSTPPRIMGSETEYTTHAIPFDKQLDRFLPDHRTYRERERDDGVDLWLENGARLYVDAGDSVLEYATPEVTSARELAFHERAGEETVQELTTNAAEWMVQNEGPVTDKAYKRSGYAEVEINKRIALYEMTAGHHENYLTPLTIVRGPLKNKLYSDLALSSFLASRSVWAGAGLVGNRGFEFSQKGVAMTFLNQFGKMTQHGQKPAYLQTAGNDGLHRLEIRVGDGNMLPEAIIRKFAVTSLVLRLIEHGEFPESLFLLESDLDRSFIDASRNAPITNIRGQQVAPAEHQRRVLDAALTFGESHYDIPDEEIEAAQEAYDICTIVKNLPADLEGASAISATVDWAAKLTDMRADQVGPLNAKNIDAVAADLRWEDIASDGPARLWDEDENGPRIDRAEVVAARLTPPATRAAVRSAVLDSLVEYPAAIRWSYIDTGEAYFAQPDPYNAEFLAS